MKLLFELKGKPVVNIETVWSNKQERSAALFYLTALTATLLFLWSVL